MTTTATATEIAMATIDFIEEIYKTHNIYCSVVLCASNTYDTVYDSLVKKDYPVSKMTASDIEEFIKGSRRMLLVPYIYVDDMYTLVPQMTNISHVINFIEDEHMMLQDHFPDALCISYE